MPEYNNFDDFYGALEKGVSENRPTSMKILQVFKDKAAKMGKAQLSDDEMMQAIGEDPQLSQGLKFTNAPIAATAPPPAAPADGAPPISFKKTDQFDPWNPSRGGDPRPEPTVGNVISGIASAATSSPIKIATGKGIGDVVRDVSGEPTSAPGKFLKGLAGTAGDYLDFMGSPLGLAAAGEAPLIAKVLMKYPKIAGALKIAAGAPAVMGAFDTSPEGLGKTATNVTAAALAFGVPRYLSRAAAASEAASLDKVKQGLSSIGSEPLMDAFYKAKPIPPSSRPVALQDFYEPRPGLATIPPGIRRPTGATPASGPHSMPGSPQGKVAAGDGIGPPLIAAPPAPDFRMPGDVQQQVSGSMGRPQISAAEPHTGPYTAGGNPQPSILPPPAQEALPPGKVSGAIEGGQSGWVPDPRANTRISAQTANELGTKYKVEPSMLVDASGHSNEELVQTVNALHARKAELSKMSGSKGDVSPAMLNQLGRIADALGELVLKRDVHSTQGPPAKR